MPRLTAVDLTYGPTIDLRFTTNIPIFSACETAVLLLSDASPGGSELGIRIERGRVVDFYIWDGGRRLRQRLPELDVVQHGRRVSCEIPSTLLPVVHGMPRLQAALIINGAAIQSGYAVTVKSRSLSSQEHALTA